MRRISLAFLLFLPVLGSAEAPRLCDSFADGELGSQALPGSARWYSSTPSLLTVESGTLRVASDEKNLPRHIAARFAAADQPVRLAVGEGLTLSFDLTLSGPISLDPNALRLGFLDSAGESLPDGRNSRVSFRGYLGLLHSSNGRFRILRRTGSPAPLVSLGGESYSAPLTARGGENGVPLAAGVTYQVSFFIIRVSETQLDIGARLSGPGLGNTATAVESGAPLTVFDTVVIALGSGVPGATFDNITVSSTAVARP